MKIRQRLNLYIAGVVVLQILTIFGLPLYTKHITVESICKTSLLMYVLAALLETVAICFLIKLSATISSSIVFLQKSTKKLAEGNVRAPLERRATPRGENEITELIEDLDKMRLALLEETERRNKFIMGMSHDLRTPIAVIKGYAEAIDDGVMDNREEIQDSVKLIHEKTEQLELMINTLINFVRLKSSDWTNILKKQPIRPALEYFGKDCKIRGEVAGKKIELHLNVNPTTKVVFDQELLQRLMGNLFSNALRYTPKGGTISLIADEDKDKIVMTIKDTGIGIDKKDIKFIFDIFYRGSNSRQDEGFGIGLSIVKNIIDIHHWKIDVDSEKNVGTSFTITVPKKDSAE